MVAFITSVLVLVVMMLPVYWFAHRRAVGEPVTWGEAAVAGVYVFAILFWAYGVLPHQFLTWADSELNWRPDRIWLGTEGKMVMPLTGWTFESPWFPIRVSAQVGRDIIVTGIYIVLLGVQIYYWVWWQNRGKRAEAAKAVEPVSPYGRPLIKRA